jgi:hypothetical protein
MVILSIMEKRPTIKRLGKTRTPPIDAPAPAVAAEKISDDVV